MAMAAFAEASMETRRSTDRGADMSPRRTRRATTTTPPGFVAAPTRAADDFLQRAAAPGRVAPGRIAQQGAGHVGAPDDTIGGERERVLQRAPLRAVEERVAREVEAEAVVVADS